MRSLPLGCYVDIPSLMHSADPLCKLVCLILLISSVILSDSVPGYLILALSLVLFAMLSHLGFRHVFGGLKRIYPFFLFILLMNALFFSDQDPLFSFWIFSFTMAGLHQGLLVILRVLFALVLGNIFTSTTSPLKITDAIEDLIRPLGAFRIPIGEVAMILGISIRFVPVFIEEADMIKKAQTARGAGFESKKLSQRAAAVLPLVIPIFISAFKRADELSLAMEARGYHGRDEKRRIARKFSAFDGVLLVFCLIILFLQIYVL